MGSRTLSNTRIAQAISFVSKQSRDIKSFSGFQKHHRLPAGHEASRMRFISEIAGADLDRNLGDVFRRMRSAFGLKRKDVVVSGPVDGTGTIVTSAFTYQVEVNPVEDDPGRIWWQRSIRTIEDHERLFSAEFDRVFGATFDTIQLDLPDSLDIESIIDHIEESDAQGVSVDYDKDATWCEIRIAESMSIMRISADSIIVTGLAEMKPRDLMEGFWQIRNRFLETLNW